MFESNWEENNGSFFKRTVLQLGNWLHFQMCSWVVASYLKCLNDNHNNKLHIILGGPFLLDNTRKKANVVVLWKKKLFKGKWATDGQWIQISPWPWDFKVKVSSQDIAKSRQQSCKILRFVDQKFSLQNFRAGKMQMTTFFKTCLNRAMKLECKMTLVILFKCF